jgi:uncharacterized protein HemX
MRELTDAEIEAMTPSEKAEYARRRAEGKYHNPALDREGDGGNKTVLWAVGITALLVLVVGVSWAWQQQTSAELEKTRDRIAEQNQFGNIHKAHSGANRK